MATAKNDEQGGTRLRELGFDPQASPAAAVAKLRSLRGTEGLDDGAIAHALSAIADAEAAQMLAEMASAASGALRREIRRALFRLHQRGINPPAPAAAAAAVPAASAESGLSAMLSPADADGARIVWLLKSRASGGLRRLWGLVSETDGLLGATFDGLTRKEFRAERANVEKRAGVPLVEADWRLADFIMCEAYRRTPAERRGRVGNFLAVRAEMTASAPDADFRHPTYDEFAQASAEAPSVELMKEPEVAGFKLPAAVVKPFADEASGLQQSVLVLNRMQQEERVATVVERALTELLTGDIAHRLRRHLEDTAYFFARVGRREPARWAAAAAAKLRDGEDLRRMAFFQTFMRAQLGAILAEQDEQRREEPRLIMTPAEAMRAQQAARARQRAR